SGIGRFVLSILKNKDYFKDYDFVLLGNKKTDFERGGLENCEKIIINDFPPPFYEQFKLHKAIKKINPDIYFSPYYKYPVFAGVKTVACIFDLIYLSVEPYKSQLKNQLYIRSFIKFFTSKVNCIITSSEHTKRDIQNFFNINDSKIKVVYLPIDEKFKPQSRSDIERVKKKYSVDREYILYVGNNSFHKNVKALYKAYTLLDEKMKWRYKLILAGFKDKKKEYQSAFVIERVDDEDLPALYSGCSLFVFPSVYEGFGYPPLEAISCGAKVVSSNSSSMPEILGDGVVYCNPYNPYDIKDKIVGVLENKIFPEGKTDLRRFSIDIFLSNIKSVLDSL
ncbi:MAG: glycosyltransferase family 4 protein, partial [Elusimicrobiales bacterium]